MEHNISRLRAIGALMLMSFSLAACASLSGAPVRVIGTTEDRTLLERYSVPKAIIAFAATQDSAREGLSPRQYRDMVVAVYLGAIDARYSDFRASVSGERRELGVGFDAVVIGLTSAAAVARDSIVNSLSATAATMAGTHAAIDRNVYFDQSLPALFAAMDAARLRARAQILGNLSRDALEYPLPTAFADLSAYELAGSIDAAILEITAQAAQDRRAAQQELAAAASPACRAEAGAVAISDRLFGVIDANAPDPDTGAITADHLLTLVKIATALEVPTGWTNPEELYAAIQAKISAGEGGQCRVTELESYMTRVRAAIGRDF